MLITRTPLRILIRGAGTDLPLFYRRRTGFVVSAAINQYMFIGLSVTDFSGVFDVVDEGLRTAFPRW